MNKTESFLSWLSRRSGLAMGKIKEITKTFVTYITGCSSQPYPIKSRPRWFSGLLRIGPLLGGLIWITRDGREIYYDNHYRWLDDLWLMLIGAFLWRVGPALYDRTRDH